MASSDNINSDNNNNINKIQEFLAHQTARGAPKAGPARARFRPRRLEMGLNEAGEEGGSGEVDRHKVGPKRHDFGPLMIDGGCRTERGYLIACFNRSGRVIGRAGPALCLSRSGGRLASRAIKIILFIFHFCPLLLPGWLANLARFHARFGVPH